VTEPERPGLSGRLAAGIVRGRYLVVVLWLVATWAATSFLPTIREAQSGSLGDLVPDDSAAIDTEIRSVELFAFPLLTRTLVVQRDPAGIASVQQADIARRVVAVNQGDYPELRRVAGALALTNAIGDPPFARERSTTGLTYLFFEPEVNRQDQEILGRRFIDRRVAPFAEGYIGLTGVVPARGAQVEAIEDALPTVQLATVLLVILIVGLHFRAVGAPAVTLVTVGIAYLISLRVMAGAGQRLGISVPSEVEPVILVLLFGVITDYSIFFLSRFRRRLGEGEPVHAAARRSTRDLLPIILTAGLTVVGGSAALVVAELGFFRAFGPGMAIAVLVGLVVAITLIPALMAIGGINLFWPSRPGRDVAAEDAAEETPDEEIGRPVRSRTVRLASARPVVVAIGCTLVLLTAATGLARLEVGNTLIRGLPDDAEPEVAYRQAAQGFTPGILSPTVVIVEGRGVADRRRELRVLQRLVAERRGVAQVFGPEQQPFAGDFGAVYSPDGDAARLLVFFRSDPLGSQAIRNLRQLRASMPALLGGAGLSEGVRADFAGDTALAEETVRLTSEDLWRIGPAALGVVLLILMVFLRALVAPVYLLAASLLSLAAALGLTTYVFQDLLGHGELTYFVPFAAAVLLLSLGSDYNVFLTGRVWEEARERPFEDAVAVGAARAATPITIAGVVLALSFAVLALVPLQPFRELAFVMAAGLLLEAFIVRTMLVPALIRLVGTAGGWPGRRLASEPRGRLAARLARRRATIAGAGEDPPAASVRRPPR
jgi:putative drug exporter of the RND superfamily